MTVPIEKLGMDYLLKERAYVKWVDGEGKSVTLGSCTALSKDNTNFLMKVVCDSEGRLHIHFSLMVTYKVTGKRRQMELLLVVPPHGDFHYASEPRPIAEQEGLLEHDVAALHEAGISNLQQIIVLSFDLRFLGFVVKKAKKSTVSHYNPASSTLIRTARSLSLTKKFKVYIRPSDYAVQSLKAIRQRLGETGAEICEFDMKNIYSHELDWTEFEYHNPLPPLYTENDAQSSTEVQVPQSPPNIHEAIILATPSPLPVYHGIFSPDCEEPPKVVGDIDPDDLDDVHKDLRHVETYPEVDSDEEYLAELNARQLSQQLRQEETSKDLGSKFKDWLNKAMAINENVYKHSGVTKKLFTLGTSVRRCNVEMFNATIVWCSTLFLCNPTDSSDTSETPPDPSRSADRPLVSDMADLIKWLHTFHFCAEMIIDDFQKLGRAAHACNMEQYRRHKLDCLYRIFVEFDDTSTSVNRESSKVLSRKRKL
ncbi:hypothetical protein ACMFMG_009429 [Clarireedia jacksonii]